MTPTEKQEIIDAVINSLQTNSLDILDLTEVESLPSDAYIEVSGGRRILVSMLVEAVLEGIDTGSIGTSLLADLCVTSAKLANSSVTLGKIDPNAFGAIAANSDKLVKSGVIHTAISNLQTLLGGRLHNVNNFLFGGIIPSTLYDYYINDSLIWRNSTTNVYNCYILPVVGTAIRIKATTVGKVRFLSEFSGITLNEDAHVVSTEQLVVGDNLLTRPSTAHFLYVENIYNNNNRLPSSILDDEVEILYNSNPATEKMKRLADETDSLKTAIGDVHIESEELAGLSFSAGGIRNQSIGAAIDISTSSAYRYTSIECAAGDTFRIRVHQSTSSNYVHYIVSTDSNDIVTGLFGEFQSTAGDYTYDCVIPEGSEKLYIATYGNNAVKVEKSKGVISLQKQIDNIATDANVVKYGYPLLDIARPVILGHNSQKKYLNFSFITDTHYREDEDYKRFSLNNMRLFRDFNKEKLFDFACHGGDIITSYGLTSAAAAKWIDDTTKIMGDIPIPFLCVVGNHDVAGRENGDSGTDYFTAPQEYMLLNNHTEAVYDAAGAFDNYYYKDFNREKIRVIVLNQYVVKSGVLSNTNLGREYQWIARIALKGIPAGFKAIILGHSSIADMEHFNAIVSAFNAATSVTGTVGGYGYSEDFSGIGEKRLVAFIHGHAHSDTFVNDGGYLDIGVINGFCDEADLGSAKEYKFSVFTVDTDNSILYETRIGEQWSDETRTVNRSFSFATLNELT